MSFICGSFQHQHEDDLEVLWPEAASATRRTRRTKSFCSRTKDNKNPYANRGLDKFSALLAELDDKRRKILTQKGSEDISLVRFVYTNSDSNNPKPIVVKLRERKQPVENSKITEAAGGNLDHKQLMTSMDQSSSTNNSEAQRAKSSSLVVSSEQKMMKKKMISFKWINDVMKFGDNWTRPSYYLPVFAILILVFLAIFGRSFAILCTSLGWYLVPTINGSFGGNKNNSSKRQKNMTKVYSRKLSEKISSPRSVLNGPEQQGHRKSF